jgi:NAD+ synthase
MNELSLKPGTEEIIEHFLSEKLRKTGAKGYVLGVSGGIDSAVVLRLAARAVGNEKVHGLIMPERDSRKADTEDAEGLCKSDGVDYQVIDISDIVDSFVRAVPEKVGRKALANVKARTRMVLLYDHAAKHGRLVLGTSNKSELLIGYFTKHGDGGADLEPIGDLYKTQVRQLASVLKLPMNIMEKTPTAGLWKGQTDEEEIGMSYDKLDSILATLELALDPRTASERTGVPVADIEKIARMVRLSAHKRRFPVVPKIGLRTPGHDWREGDEDL